VRLLSSGSSKEGRQNNEDTRSHTGFGSSFHRQLYDITAEFEEGIDGLETQVYLVMHS